MNTRPERLDKDGFPIPAGFDANDPVAAERSPRGPAVRSVLRWIVLAGLLVALWVHFDLGTQVRNQIGNYLCKEGIRQYYRNDLQGALASFDRAVDWAPNYGRAVTLRMTLHLELKNWQAALDDSHRAAEVDEGNRTWIGGRLSALQGLKRHRETVDFCSEMLQRSLGDQVSMLNTRAYARAQGGFELTAALADIEQVLAKDPAFAKPEDDEKTDEKNEEKKEEKKRLKEEVAEQSPDEIYSVNQSKSALIDTRGYVLLKLGRVEEALDDLEQAVGYSNKAFKALALLIIEDRVNKVPRVVTERRSRFFDESRGEILHHRAEAYQKLGKVLAAEKDFAEAKKLGYDEAPGAN